MIPQLKLNIKLNAVCFPLKPNIAMLYSWYSKISISCLMLLILVSYCTFIFYSIKESWKTMENVKCNMFFIFFNDAGFCS